jgi:hypothetical protein
MAKLSRDTTKREKARPGELDYRHQLGHTTPSHLSLMLCTGGYEDDLMPFIEMQMDVAMDPWTAAGARRNADSKGSRYAVNPNRDSNFPAS